LGGRNAEEARRPVNDRMRGFRLAGGVLPGAVRSQGRIGAGRSVALGPCLRRRPDGIADATLRIATITSPVGGTGKGSSFHRVQRRAAPRLRPPQATTGPARFAVPSPATVEADGKGKW